MESMDQKWTALDCLFINDVIKMDWECVYGAGNQCQGYYQEKSGLHYPCHSSGRAKYPKVFAFAWLVVSLSCAGATLQELVQLQAMISSALQAQSDAVLRCGKIIYGRWRLTMNWAKKALSPSVRKQVARHDSLVVVFPFSFGTGVCAVYKLM